MKHLIPNIIHLPNQTDRWNLLKKELDRQNLLNYRVWFGNTEGKPRDNIARTHKEIVQYLKESDYPEGIIMEDDCMFPSEDGFAYFLRNKPSDYDIYLGGIYTGAKAMTAQTAKHVRRFSGFHLYCINQRFYDTYISLNTKKQDIDNAVSALAVQGKCKIVCCYPFAAIQRELKSSNSGCVYLHKNFFNEINVRWGK